jgi:mRNA interferase MazF
VAVAVKHGPVRRGDVHLVRLDPTVGSEVRKTRPCLVVSPDELNDHLRTVIVAPMTTGGHAYPWRIPCRFQHRSGFVAVDQLRTVDGERLVKRLGQLSAATTTAVLDTLQEMFEE